VVTAVVMAVAAEVVAVACAATAALIRRCSCMRLASSSASEAPFMNAHRDLRQQQQKQ